MIRLANSREIIQVGWKIAGICHFQGNHQGRLENSGRLLNSREMIQIGRLITQKWVNSREMIWVDW
jgi:hypothetical protein